MVGDSLINSISDSFLLKLILSILTIYVMNFWFGFSKNKKIAEEMQNSIEGVLSNGKEHLIQVKKVPERAVLEEFRFQALDVEDDIFIEIQAELLPRHDLFRLVLGYFFFQKQRVRISFRSEKPQVPQVFALMRKDAEYEKSRSLWAVMKFAKKRPEIDSKYSMYSEVFEASAKLSLAAIPENISSFAVSDLPFTEPLGLSQIDRNLHAELDLDSLDVSRPVLFALDVISQVKGTQLAGDPLIKAVKRRKALKDDIMKKESEKKKSEIEKKKSEQKRLELRKLDRTDPAEAERLREKAKSKRQQKIVVK